MHRQNLDRKRRMALEPPTALRHAIEKATLEQIHDRYSISSAAQHDLPVRPQRQPDHPRGWWAMSLPIITADQRLVERRGIKLVIFGKSGIGKTSLLWTLNSTAAGSTGG